MSLLADDNLAYLVGGFVAFWVLVAGYWWSLRQREESTRRELSLWEE